MSSQNPQINKNDDAINSFDPKQIANILDVEKQILVKETSIAKVESYIAKRSGFMSKIVMAVGFLTILSISLTGALISQNIDNKNSQAAISYSCLPNETLNGTNCISDASSYPVYGEGCANGYIIMQSVCAKIVQKTCADFPEAVIAETDFCKIGDINNVLLSEVTDVDGRTCNGNGYNFKRYNVGFTTNSNQGPVICASAFSGVFGKANFRFTPQIITDIQNFTTSQTGSKTVPCLPGYLTIRGGDTKCSRPATILGCTSGGEYLGNFNLFGSIKANAQVITNNQTTTTVGNGITTTNTNNNGQITIEVSASSKKGQPYGEDGITPPPNNSVSSQSLLQPVNPISLISISSSSLSNESLALLSISQLATSNPNLSTLATALSKADLVNIFSGSTKYTVLAPTNDAFAKISPKTLELLLKPENKDTLIKLLKYHVLDGEVKSNQIANFGIAKTLEGSNVDIELDNGNIYINTNALVTTADIQASNGVIHTIDDVLLPASVDLDKLLDSTTASSTQAPAPVNPTNLSCKVCPAGQYCPNNTTGVTTLILCVNGGSLSGDKCIAPNKLSQTTYTDGCSSEYVKLDQSCAIIEVRTHDLSCSYYYASDNENVLAVLSGDGVRCSTGGRTDFENTSIVKVSDLQCDGPGSAYYNYNVAYDPLVCGKGDPINKTDFRWSQKSFTQITGLQKLAKNTFVCPATWISLSDTECYQLVSTQEYRARNDCPANTYCPEGSTVPTPCPANTASPAKSTKLSDCIATNNNGGVIIISTGFASSSSSSSSQAQSVVCTSKPGEYFTNGVCVPCVAGYYCLGGNNAPIICPIAYYCPLASTNPTPCPVGTTTLTLGSRILEDCKAIAKPAITVVRTGGLQVFITIFSTLSLFFFGYIYLSSKNAKGQLNQGWSKIK
jgi:uncharacterized surface protein with fasciclin (FAS1) repeats